MSLETHIAGVDDALVSPLHFSGSPNTASYVTERRNCSFAPQSGGVFGPGGVRLLRFNLADQSGFLDGSTLRLAFELKNTHASNSLTPISSSPACLFRRMRVIANGSAEIEDIDEYGRVFEIFHTMMPSARRMNDVCETWSAAATAHTLSDAVNPQPLGPTKSRRVVCTLLSPFLNQGKYIPLNMVPVVLELEVGEYDFAFTGTGNTWEIFRPRLIADVLSVENSLQNSYAKLMLDGRSLPIPMHGIYSVKAAITNGSYFSLPITRGFTRLSTIYFTFIDDGSLKECTHYPHPALYGVADNDTSTDDFEFWVTIGADRYPQFSVDSVQESWYRLRVASLIHQGTDSFAISAGQYRSDKFIAALNLEKAPGSAGHSGVNTRGGSQMTLHFKNIDTSKASFVHVILHCDQVCSASAAGVELLD